MKRILCIVAGMATLVTACAAAPAGTQTTAANVGPDGEPLVCRSIKVTGTRFPQKECKTAAAWEEYDAYTNSNARESTDKIQRVNSGGATNSGG